MKIIITGALGHIGSKLIREIPVTFPGVKIVMLDNLLTQRYCSLFDLPSHAQYQFIEDDILTADLVSVFTGATVVIHLAAITNATDSFQNQEEVNNVNFTGTERVALACQEVGCALIYPSTTSVYGSQLNEVDENYPLKDLKPQSPYAETKLQAEHLLQNLGEEKGLNFITCRLGTIFGTSIGMRFHTAVNKFCWQAVMGQPLTVWKTAQHQYRPYLDLVDAVEAIKFIIHKKLYDRRVYNIVTTNASISNIMDVISMHMPDITVEYVDTQIMNQLSYRVSNNRFLGQGFKFKGDLERGIGMTIDLIKVARKGLGVKAVNALEGT